MDSYRIGAVLLALLLLPGLLIAGASSSGATGSPGPERVLIVYDADWTGDEDHNGVQDSLQVAQYYALKRGVPAQNMLGIHHSAPLYAGYFYQLADYPKFQSDVVQPIKAKLAALGPANIDIILMSYQTPIGVQSNPASYQGGGYVSLDNVLMGLNAWNPGSDSISWSVNPYYEPSPTFGTDKGHFDHTLYLFGNTQMYMVSRLDSPLGLAGTLNLIDQALYGERYISAQPGYYNGNVYVDSGNAKGEATDAGLAADPDVQNGNFVTTAQVDVNIAYAEHYVLASGLPLKWEKSGSIIGTPGTVFADGTSAATAPRALMYGGWYAYQDYINIWEWLPGSVACDFDSSSLTDWGRQALMHGATAVAGVIGEPYTTGHTRPNVLIYYMLNGYTFAEASTLANPSIGWMSYAIGDPLYKPFAPKTPVRDTQAPVFVVGYPSVSQSADGTGMNVLVDDSAGPEVVKITMDYGTTTTYGNTIDSKTGYGRRNRLVFPALAAGATYYYRVTVTDPVGNTTVSGGLTFSLASDGSLLPSGPPPPPPTDTIPPTVSLTQPASGSILSGTVSVTATASDNVGVVGVQFMLDGQTWGAEKTTAPYILSVDTTGVSNGVHTLTAIARDAAGNRTTAPGVAVTVTNNITSTTSLIVNGSSVAITVAPGATVTVGVQNDSNANDWVGLYATGSTAAALKWDYLNGRTTIPFTMPSTTGTYEFRLFDYNAYNKRATSPAVAVQTGVVPTVTAVIPTQGTVGSSLPVTITGTNFQSGATLSVGAGITVSGPAVSSGTQLTATLVIATGATLGVRDVTVTNPGGQSGTLSSGFTVSTASAQPSLTVNGSSVAITVAPGATVTVGVQNDTNAYDWVGMFPTGSTTNLTWYFLNGRTNIPFTVPSIAGTYEFRLFDYNAYNKLATSPPVTAQ